MQHRWQNKRKLDEADSLIKRVRLLEHKQLREMRLQANQLTSDLRRQAVRQSHQQHLQALRTRREMPVEPHSQSVGGVAHRSWVRPSYFRKKQRMQNESLIKLRRQKDLQLKKSKRSMVRLMQATARSRFIESNSRKLQHLNEQKLRDCIRVLDQALEIERSLIIPLSEKVRALRTMQLENSRYSGL